jgi:hypothetical protein
MTTIVQNVTKFLKKIDNRVDRKQSRGENFIFYFYLKQCFSDAGPQILVSGGLVHIFSFRPFVKRDYNVSSILVQHKWANFFGKLTRLDMLVIIKLEGYYLYCRYNVRKIGYPSSETHDGFSTGPSIIKIENHSPNLRKKYEYVLPHSATMHKARTVYLYISFLFSTKTATVYPNIIN